MEDALKKTYNFMEMMKRTISYHLEIYLMEIQGEEFGEIQGG